MGELFKIWLYIVGTISIIVLASQLASGIVAISSGIRVNKDKRSFFLGITLILIGLEAIQFISCNYCDRKKSFDGQCCFIQHFFRSRQYCSCIAGSGFNSTIQPLFHKELSDRKSTSDRGFGCQGYLGCYFNILEDVFSFLYY